MKRSFSSSSSSLLLTLAASSAAWLLIITIIFKINETRAWEYQTVNVAPNLNLSVAIEGPNNAANKVILLHGFPEGSWAWEPFVEAAKNQLLKKKNNNGDGDGGFQFVAPRSTWL